MISSPYMVTVTGPAQARPARPPRMVFRGGAWVSYGPVDMPETSSCLTRYAARSLVDAMQRAGAEVSAEGPEIFASVWRIPETGATIGPLPDRRTVEVRPVSWRDLAAGPLGVRPRQAERHRLVGAAVRGDRAAQDWILGACEAFWQMREDSMNFASQPDLVRASLLADEQRENHHDAPSSRRGHQHTASDERGVRGGLAPVAGGHPSHGVRSGSAWPCHAGPDAPLPAASVDWVDRLCADAQPEIFEEDTQPNGLVYADCGVCAAVPGRDGRRDLIEQASCRVHGWENHPVTASGAMR